MKFCNYCESAMTKQTALTGIVFQCRCQNIIAGGPDDTLMDEEFFNINNSALKHEVFIENAPFDLAANIVLKDCPKCNINYMIMAVPDNTTMTSLYICGECGYKATHEEYIKHVATMSVDKNIDKTINKSADKVVTINTEEK